MNYRTNKSLGYVCTLPGLGGLKETKNVSSPSTCESQYWGSLRDREVACSASDRQGSNFESCVWRTVLSHSSHHPQEVLLAQFSLYVHKGGLKPDSFHFYVCTHISGLVKLKKIQKSEKNSGIGQTAPTHTIFFSNMYNNKKQHKNKNKI